MRHGGHQWARARLVTIAAAALALMLVLGPVVAGASTTGSTHPGVSLRENVDGGGFAMHNELLGTDPPYGAQLDTGPSRIVLTFDLPAQRGFSTVIVTGPDRNQWQAGPASEDGTSVSAPVRPLGPAGEYTVAWRIVSADGHPTQGTFPFTLTTQGTGTAAAPNPDRSGSATDPGSAGPSGWLWLAGVGALLAGGVVMALRFSRTRR